MGTLNFTAFGGIAPRADPITLPAGFAQKANNCRFTTGAMEGFRGMLTVRNVPFTNLQNIYRMGITHAASDVLNSDYWLVSSNPNTSIIKGAIANDVDERTYITDGAQPSVTTLAFATASQPYPAIVKKLGLPAPGLKPSGAVDPLLAPQVTVVGPIDPSVAGEVRYYCYTYIDAATAWAPGAYAFNQESGPSAPSLPVKYYASSDPGYAQTINVTIPAMNSVSTSGYIITGVRLYRTAVTNGGTSEFQYVGTYNIGPNSFQDTVLNTQLGEVLPTKIAALLPNNAIGLTGMANGMMAAFNGYDVYFCETYKPYSWPIDYRQTVDYPIVGIGAFGTTLVVLTTGVPFLMSGSDPQSISVQKLPYNLICMARKSVISTEGGVIFASQEGLISVGSGGVTNVTEQAMTRREWMTYNPASMVCGYWEGKVFVFYDATSLGGTLQKGCLIIDSDGRITTNSTYATAVYNDPASGALYLAVDNKICKWDAGGDIVSFDSGTAAWSTADPAPYTWHSKREMLPAFNNFGWAQVISDTYPVSLTVYQNGLATTTTSVTSSVPVRLTSGFKSIYWEVEVSGTGRLFQIVLANSTSEIQRV